jgi:ribonuclease P protein component
MNISSLHNIKTLRKRNEIKAVLDYGKKISTKYGLIFLYNDGEHLDKKAAVLLKKSVGSAVKRNYIKRILRSIIRNHHNIIFNDCNRVVFIYNYNGDSAFSLIEEEYLNKLKKV